MDRKLAIRRFLGGFLPVESLSDDTQIFATGFVNSLFAMELVLFIEKEFRINIEPEELDISNLGSLNAIDHFLERKACAAADTTR